MECFQVSWTSASAAGHDSVIEPRSSYHRRPWGQPQSLLSLPPFKSPPSVLLLLHCSPRHHRLSNIYSNFFSEAYRGTTRLLMNARLKLLLAIVLPLLDGTSVNWSESRSEFDDCHPSTRSLWPRYRNSKPLPGIIPLGDIKVNTIDRS